MPSPSARRRPPAQHPRRARTARVRRRRALLGLLLAALASGLALLLTGGSAGRRHGAEAHAASSRAGVSGASGAASARTANTGAGYPETAEVRRLIALGHPIYCAPRRGNEVALTFDDGPGTYTRLMIDKLRKHHVEATFFIVGRNIPLLPGATRQERALGAVGDHTFTHPLLTELPEVEAETQISHTQHDLEAASGGPVFLFRPPYGGRSPAIDSIARRHGLLEILWDVDSADSLGASYAQIEHTVIGGLQPGSIILMHENHGQTVRAMLAIFAALQRKHLRPVSVPQLLTDDPPSTAQVLAGGSGCGLGSTAKLGGS